MADRTAAQAVSRRRRLRPSNARLPDRLRAEAAGFVGTLEQVPSAVSAVKVDGRRAYARVRAGEAVELAPRTVTVEFRGVPSGEYAVSSALTDSLGRCRATIQQVAHVQGDRQDR